MLWLRAECSPHPLAEEGGRINADKAMATSRAEPQQRYRSLQSPGGEVTTHGEKHNDEWNRTRPRIARILGILKRRSAD